MSSGRHLLAHSPFNGRRHLETPVSLSIEQLVVNALSVDRLITIDLLGSVQITRLVVGDADTTGYLFIVTRPDSLLTIGTVSSPSVDDSACYVIADFQSIVDEYRSRQARQVSSTTRRSGLSTQGEDTDCHFPLENPFAASIVAFENVKDVTTDIYEVDSTMFRRCVRVSARTRSTSSTSRRTPSRIPSSCWTGSRRGTKWSSFRRRRFCCSPSTRLSWSTSLLSSPMWRTRHL